MSALSKVMGNFKILAKALDTSILKQTKFTGFRCEEFETVSPPPPLHNSLPLP